MVHPAAYPLTWLSCLKHHHDPQCFIWCLLVQHHKFCFLGSRQRKHIPCPAATITFCTLSKHNPNPTATDYSLGRPICAAIGVLPQTRVHQAPMHSQPQSPGMTSGCVLPTGRWAPQHTLQACTHNDPDQRPCCTSAPPLPKCTRASFSRKAGHVLAWCKPACPHEQMCSQKPWLLWCTAMYPAMYLHCPCVWGKNLPSEKV